MKRLLLIVLATAPLFLSTPSWAAGDSHLELEKVTLHRNDTASLMRGAQFFAQNCMTCHTMKYLQHDTLAQKAGITPDKMPLKNQEWWLNIVPPDLTLIARQYSPDWLYTYMHAFYKDPSRPTGYNNLLKKDVNMMNIFVAYQGEQVLAPQAQRLATHPRTLTKPRYHALLELKHQGSMTPDQFDQVTTDLVNFLVYAGDPAYTQHHNLGYWVIGFLLILLVLAILLKKAYWKDVPHNRSPS